jgi:hypothetical protein
MKKSKNAIKLRLGIDLDSLNTKRLVIIVILVIVALISGANLIEFAEAILTLLQ